MGNGSGNCKLFIGSLSYQADDIDLDGLFSEVGHVKEAKVLRDKETNKSRGFGFVTMETPKLAQEAIDTLNGAELCGRTISVAFAEDKGGKYRGERGKGR